MINHKLPYTKNQLLAANLIECRQFDQQLWEPLGKVVKQTPTRIYVDEGYDTPVVYTWTGNEYRMYGKELLELSCICRDGVTGYFTIELDPLIQFTLNKMS
jgi:hypothetical protein